MSMIARFVAITPDQLATIKDTPEMVGGVFALDAGLPFESPSDLQERLRRQAPQLVADMLERLPPAVRQQLRQRLGLGDNGVPNPGADNVVLLQLAQREAARRRAPPGNLIAIFAFRSARKRSAPIAVNGLVNRYQSSAQRRQSKRTHCDGQRKLIVIHLRRVRNNSVHLHQRHGHFPRHQQSRNPREQS